MFFEFISVEARIDCNIYIEDCAILPSSAMEDWFFEAIFGFFYLAGIFVIVCLFVFVV